MSLYDNLLLMIHPSAYPHVLSTENRKDPDRKKPFAVIFFPLERQLAL